MPTVTEGLLSGYDNTATTKQNISDLIDAIDRREVPFLALLGWSLEGDVTKGANSLKFPCTQPEHTWQNDELIPNSTTLAAAHAVGSGTLVVASGTARYYTIGEILVLTSGGNTSHFEITNINESTDVLTVSVIANDQAHASGTKLFSMGGAAQRGDEFAVKGKTTIITTDTNYTQILGGGKEGVVAVDGTLLATEQYGIQDQMIYQWTKRLQELAIKLEQLALYGVRSTSLPTSVTDAASRMGGLWYYIKTLSGGQTKDANGADFAASEVLLKDLLDDIWNQGGRPSMMMMNTYNRRKFSDMLVPFVQTARSETVLGIVGDTYHYHHGDLSVALNKHVHASHVWVLSPEYIGIGPLAGNGNDRSFAVYDLPKTGDSERKQILGEYTMEVRNRQRAHGLIEDLAA
jgi:hypothetical protein